MEREHYNKTNEQIVATDAMIVTTIIISFQCLKLVVIYVISLFRLSVF